MGSLFLLCVGVSRMFLCVHKEQGNAPDTCKSNNNVYYSCEYGGRTACNPCNEVEGEKSDKTPVNSAYYCENKRKFVYNHHIYDRTFS